MIEKLMRMLSGRDAEDGLSGQDGSEFAVALLLIEAARSDDTIDPRELNVIERTLERRFNLDRGQVAGLLEAATKVASEPNDIFRSTQLIVERFSDKERAQVIEMLWEVAYADGEVTDDEDSLIRLVAGLIYVSDIERGEAKHRVQRRLGAGLPLLFSPEAAGR